MRCGVVIAVHPDAGTVDVEQCGHRAGFSIDGCRVADTLPLAGPGALVEGDEIVVDDSGSAWVVLARLHPPG